jgi:hypothetical protein
MKVRFAGAGVAAVALGLAGCSHARISARVADAALATSVWAGDPWWGRVRFAGHPDAPPLSVEPLGPPEPPRVDHASTLEAVSGDFIKVYGSGFGPYAADICVTLGDLPVTVLEVAPERLLLLIGFRQEPGTCDLRIDVKDVPVFAIPLTVVSAEEDRRRRMAAAAAAPAVRETSIAIRSALPRRLPGLWYLAVEGDAVLPDGAVVSVVAHGTGASGMCGRGLAKVRGGTFRGEVLLGAEPADVRLLVASAILEDQIRSVREEAARTFGDGARDARAAMELSWK